MIKLAIIVGMGPGVSAAIARRFGRKGFHIAAIARRADAIKSITADLSAAGIRATGSSGCGEPIRPSNCACPNR